jgi:NAD+ kinase
MKRPTFQRIGVIANLEKGPVDSLVGEFIPELVKQGFDVFIDPPMEAMAGSIAGVEIGIPKDCDLIAAFGGDGTILSVARRYLSRPILGLKGGRLGFLTEPLHKDVVTRLKNQRYAIQERMRITVAIMDGGETVQEFTALNDVVVHGAVSRMVALRTEVDGIFVREYSADGVVVATPTGSTAYSLSAGGPILTPTLHAILLTPLCPHKLSVRPIVVDGRERVRVSVVRPRTDIRVTVDGQKGTDLKEGQQVSIEKSRVTTKLLVPDDYDFFGMLREKL